MIKNLTAIQNELKANKSRYNSFGKYSYRSCEDILTAVKPLLAKYHCQMTISDEVVAVGNRIYIKATTTITDEDGNSESVTAYARESEAKKGMDDSQISGCASSYARKYSVSGMFLIDDTKDADTDEYHYQSAYETPVAPSPAAEPDLYDDHYINKDFLIANGTKTITDKEVQRLRAAVTRSGKSIDNACAACKKSRPEDLTYIEYVRLMNHIKHSSPAA